MQTYACTHVYTHRQHVLVRTEEVTRADTCLHTCVHARAACAV